MSETCAECGEFPLHYRHTNKKHKRYHEFEPIKLCQMCGHIEGQHCSPLDKTTGKVVVGWIMFPPLHPEDTYCYCGCSSYVGEE